MSPYRCGREGCDFFLWVEDNPLLVAAELDDHAETEEEFHARQALQWKQRYGISNIFMCIVCLCVQSSIHPL